MIRIVQLDMIMKRYTVEQRELVRSLQLQYRRYVGINSVSDRDEAHVETGDEKTNMNRLSHTNDIQKKLERREQIRALSGNG